MTDGAIAAAPRDKGNQAPPIGGNELAHGLMLVRASAMNVARLHLAVEGQDRRRLLQSMDELVALDREIDDFVAEIPTSDTRLESRQDELTALRQTLARDKLLLGAGISRRAMQEDPAPAISRGHGATEVDAIASEPGFVAEAPPIMDTETDADHARPRLGVLVPALLILLLLALGAAGFLFLTFDGQTILDHAGKLLAR